MSIITKPTVFPVWATDNVVDPISGQNNVVTPPPEKQAAGWDRLEFPPRNWFNWLGRYTYQWLAWLDQQESQSVTTDGAGIGLFTTDGALITLTAVDSANPTNYIFAVGFKEVGVAPVLNVIDSNTLAIGTGTITGDQAITGGTAGDIIVNGVSRLVP